MPRARPVYSADCETDPFLHGRMPKPFVWGLFDGKRFEEFHGNGELDSTAQFVKRVEDKEIVIYAHNGGKFDFMFLLPYIGLDKPTKAQVINGRIVSIKLGKAELRDSFAIVPEAQRNWGGKVEIEMWKLEERNRAQYMQHIMERNKDDCVKLWQIVTQYREMAGNRTTIASNALAFAKKQGINPGRTSHAFDEVMRDYYYGGRTECFQPGTHYKIHSVDIHSAYPFAMLQDHASGGNEAFHNQSDFTGMSDGEIKRSFIHLKCFSKGAFPVRENGLKFPHEYREYKVTGWEYVVAKEFDLIEREEILNVKWSEKTINFVDYVEHWYGLKASVKKKDDPITYTIAKIMLNSLYGKLAQNIAHYHDYVFCKSGTRVDEENGWQLFTEYAGHEIHRRETLWKYKFEFGVEWKHRHLYNNVATGASITGFTRAHLLRAMCQIKRETVIYCDTDGIVANEQAEISNLTFSPAIGDWELEDTSPVGHFAGKKLYGIRLSKPDGEGKPKFKIASKGSRLDFEHMERLLRGEKIFWKNDAPSFSIDGSVKFVSRSIRQTAFVRSAANDETERIAL